MNRSDLRWPWRGLLHFLAHPRIWLMPLSGSFGGRIGLVVATLAAAIWHWPLGGPCAWWPAARWLGLIAMTLATAFAVLLPLMRGGVGTNVLRHILICRGFIIDRRGAVRDWRGRIAFFLLALPVRILWGLAIWGAAGLHPWLGVALGLWMVNHLVILDACDQALSLIGLADRPRRLALLRRTPVLLVVALLMALVYPVLALSLAGLYLWIPALFCGAGDWVLTWHEVTTRSPAPSPESQRS